VIDQVPAAGGNQVIEQVPPLGVHVFGEALRDWPLGPVPVKVIVPSLTAGLTVAVSVVCWLRLGFVGLEERARVVLVPVTDTCVLSWKLPLAFEKMALIVQVPVWLGVKVAVQLWVLLSWQFVVKVWPFGACSVIETNPVEGDWTFTVIVP
jgi:hypothetical protein